MSRPASHVRGRLRLRLCRTSTRPPPRQGRWPRPQLALKRRTSVAAPSTVSPSASELHDSRVCRDGRHRMYVVGYLHGPAPTGLDCLSPLRVLCRDCDHRAAWACSGHRESVCRPCAARYRRRVRTVAESGMRRESGYLYLLTLTAPGKGVHHKRGGEVCRCTGPGGVDLAAWNTTHSRRWNHFRTRLRQAYPDAQYFRGVEVQTRGALHDHAMVWSAEPLPLSWVRELAMDCGFGHSVDLAPCIPGSRKAAYYVAKYVTKATDSRESVPWIGERLDVRTGEVTVGLVPGRYRTWSTSREWGTTMAAVREAAREYAASKRAEAQPAAAPGPEPDVPTSEPEPPSSG